MKNLQFKESTKSCSKLIEFESLSAEQMDEASMVIQNALEQTQKSTQPKFIHLAGIPGSGKSTHSLNLIKQLPNYIIASMDSVMENLDGYKRDLSLFGSVEAYKKWEHSARNITYFLIQVLVENKRNVIFDHSAADKRHVGLIDKVRELGYQVEMHFISCSEEVALKRTSQREKQANRHVPEQYIYERKKLLDLLIPKYKQKTLFKEIKHNNL